MTQQSATAQVCFYMKLEKTAMRLLLALFMAKLGIESVDFGSVPKTKNLQKGKNTIERVYQEPLQYSLSVSVL